MYMGEGTARIETDVGAITAAATCLGLVAVLGVFPNVLIRVLSTAVR